MHKLTLCVVVILLLAVPVGAASAQDGGDPCMERGGMIDAATGHCVIQAGLSIDIDYPLEIMNLGSAPYVIDDFLNGLRGDFVDQFALYGMEYYSPGAWVLGVDYTIYVRPGFGTSVVFTIYEYSGGAHGFSHYKTFLFSETDGRSLRLADLFQPGSNPYVALGQATNTQLTALLGMPPDFISNAEDPLEYQKFALTADSLIIYFDQYQIAAGAAGPIEITIPLIDLAGVLVPALWP